MNLQETENYSPGSIRTMMEDYMEEMKPQMYQELNEKGKLMKFLIPKSERAMDMLNGLMEAGYQENEAWEVVSKEIVYF